MKRVTLPGTDLETSVLGFGTVGGSLDDDGRLRMYELAYENGVTHFDTARAYGLGWSEGLLGQFLASKDRSRITVTTKLGLVPPAKRTYLNAARAAVRRLGRVFPEATNLIKSKLGARLVEVRRFSAEEARLSLDTSLRELGTDYVDILLLHECRPNDVKADLLGFLEESARAGKIRYAGIATSAADTREILSQGSGFPAIVQVANSILEPELQTLPIGGRGLITHSILGRSLEKTRSSLAERPEDASAWSVELGVDLRDARTVASLHVRWARLANPNGLLLFYSCRDEHLLTDIAALDDGLVTASQALAFGVKVRSEGIGSQGVGDASAARPA